MMAPRMHRAIPTKQQMIVHHANIIIRTPAMPTISPVMISDNLMGTSLELLTKPSAGLDIKLVAHATGTFTGPMKILK